MGYTIVPIYDGDKKAEYANTVLRKLPEWFGIEQSIRDYIHTVPGYPFWAAFDGDNCIGFFCGRIHHARTGEIYVCGIDPAYHGKGIGTLLYRELERWCIEKGCEYIIVKTVSEPDTDKHYGKTVMFYKSVGFRELVTIPEMWDENNPCLIMIKGF